MLDGRHPDDQLFLFFENDWRLYEKDCLQSEEWLPLVVGDQTWPASSSDGPAVFGAKPGSRPKTTEGSDVSEFLKDVVQTCTQAHREGRGEIVWFSWNASTPGNEPKRKESPSYGTFFVAFSKSVCETLWTAMQNVKPMHFDNWLLSAVTPGKDGASRPLVPEACYVCPPVGGYTHHESDIYQGCRPSPWKESWSLEGGLGALDKWGRKRRLCKFTRVGAAEKIADVAAPNPTDEFIWKTEFPPDNCNCKHKVWRTLLQDRMWVDGDGNYIGPQSVKGGGKGLPKELQELYRWPDGYRWWEDRWSPITRLAEQLCVSPEGEARFALSDRVQRLKKNRLNQYKHRSFAVAGEKVAFCASHSVIRLCMSLLHPSRSLSPA